jgi:tartrate dehydratase alpha subunit/fumarate hydratase class I-like protein
MKNPVELYYLYCLNMQCQVSIYHRMVELRVPFTSENLTATHICPCCNQPLVSLMDIEIRCVMAGSGAERSNKVNHLHN